MRQFLKPVFYPGRLITVLKKILTITTIIFLNHFSYGQAVTRFDKETAEQFITRFKPGNAELTHAIPETKWNLKPALIAFYDQLYKLPAENDPDQQEYHRIIASIFLQADSIHYDSYLIDTFDTDGGDPKIETVFFANADKDKQKELIIIVSWAQQHYDASGALYGTFVFDDLLKTGQTKLNSLKSISAKLTNKKCRTAKVVKTELIRLGYKQ